MTPKKALSVASICERWGGCEKSRVYALINEGLLPAFKLGPRMTRVWEHDLEAYEQCLTEQSRPTSEAAMETAK